MENGGTENEGPDLGRSQKVKLEWRTGKWSAYKCFHIVSAYAIMCSILEHLKTFSCLLSL